VNILGGEMVEHFGLRKGFVMDVADMEENLDSDPSGDGGGLEACSDRSQECSS
jgi:hypothetical protein